jgi:hypothetical protein
MRIPNLQLAWVSCLFNGLRAACLLAQPSPEGPILQSPARLDGTFQFAVTVAAATSLGIERSRDFAVWEEFASSHGSVDPVLVADATLLASDHQFYRAVVRSPNTAVVTNYHGWTNAILLGNGLVEALIVPNAGRVMQFRFVGETNGPFFENPALFGKTANSSSWNTTGGFGGDKSWPSPQSDWNWPPPTGFDGSPCTASIDHGVVWLTGPVDSGYKIQVTRQIELAFDAPELRITTTFERMTATTRTNRALGIWIVTQLADPIRCYLPMASPSIFTNGYFNLASSLPKGFAVTNGLLIMPRSTSGSFKVGSDAGTVLWVGTNWCVRIDSPRVPGMKKSDYPDSGCSAEIYTNPNPVAYVELELLGPLEKLPVGGKMTRTSVYRLFQRQDTNPDAEARRLLGLSSAPQP